MGEKNEVFIATQSQDDQKNHEDLLQALYSVLNEEGVANIIREEYSQNLLQALLELAHTKVAVTNPDVDLNLIKEMGKAYRQRYDAANDDKQRERAHGAMQVLGQIKNMMSNE